MAVRSTEKYIDNRGSKVSDTRKTCTYKIHPLVGIDVAEIFGRSMPAMWVKNCQLLTRIADIKEHTSVPYIPSSSGKILS